MDAVFPDWYALLSELLMGAFGVIAIGIVACGLAPDLLFAWLPPGKKGVSEIMSKYYLFQDQKRCIGCMACVAACKSRQALPRGPFPSLVVAIGPRRVGNLPRTAYTFMPCFHCENPWCVAACPTGAMRPRTEDGIVTVDPDFCVGCKTCISACPWGAPQWNPETGKAVKCDYCYERVEAGLEPACVTVCPTKCLYFGTPDEIPEVRRERYARARAHDL